MKDKENFLNNMKAAIDLETSVATQQRIIDQYTQQMERIRPKLIASQLPFKPIEPTYEKIKLSDLLNTSGIGGVIFILFFFSIVLIGGFIGLLAGTSEGLYIGLPFFIIGAIPYIMIITKSYRISARNAEKRQNYLSAVQEYELRSASVANQNEQFKNSFKTNLELWQRKRTNDIATLEKTLTETKQLLKKLYKKDFLYSKYFNLPALTSIYEYFITGRCDELTGPHGAYNIYEDEVRKDIIISQLNTIIENLDRIKQNQYMLYQQMKIMSDHLQVIGTELNTVISYTGTIMHLSAINAYYSSVIATNSRISATMHLLNG